MLELSSSEPGNCTFLLELSSSEPGSCTLEHKLLGKKGDRFVCFENLPIAMSTTGYAYAKLLALISVKLVILNGIAIWVRGLFASW
ncbi:MAG: hypothetical protein V7L04_01650 [Nostoc sp.]|uniref:hypothetical protein n=1 Tax=Nostoc sp. TaxID=1180 RepID=UPI002FF59142